jgi:DHA1 family bicyclomycin/chloramphenicol resistance-like MFS transporter
MRWLADRRRARRRSGGPLGLSRTIGLGALALATGGLAMVVSVLFGGKPMVWLVLSMTTYHTGLMLAMPQAIAGAMTPFPHCAGTASSLIGLVQQLSAASLGAAVGHLVGHSAWPLAGAVATMGCLTLAVWAGSRLSRNERAQGADGIEPGQAIALGD